MFSQNRSFLILSLSILIGALSITLSIFYHTFQDRYEIAGVGGSSDNIGALYRLEKATGKVEACRGYIDERTTQRIFHVSMDCTGNTHANVQ